MLANSRTVTTSRRVLGLSQTLFLAAVLAAGCGSNAHPGENDAHADGGDSTDGRPSTDAGPAIDAAPPIDAPVDAAVAVSPWTELPAGTVSLAGGAATTATGQAKPGGTLHLVSRGGINFDTTLPAPTPIAIPPAPAGAMRPDSLPADLDVTGSVVIDGPVMSTGTDGVRTITATGDIYIIGTLTTADLGATRQGLRLSATSGNVYVVASGSIDAGGSGPGQAGGGVALAGQQIVIAGQIRTEGGGGFGPGAAAGPIALRATSNIQVVGAIDAMGGDGRGDADVGGGHGGDLGVQLGGDLTLTGIVRLRGGAALSMMGGASGGAGGTTVIDSDSAVVIGGVLDARGGLARSDGAAAAVTGGAAGALRVGESAAPTRVDLLVAAIVSGGDGGDIGGNGGVVNLQPRAGNLRIASRLEVSGGASGRLPGAGGVIDGHPGPNTETVTDAGVIVAGAVIASGGATAGATATGGVGGLIRLVNLTTDGDITVTTTGMIAVDGGQAGGHGGAGGEQYLFTLDGDASMAGHLFARGGDAAGGTGGEGGLVYLFTDANHGGPGPGNLTIETDGVIDASGGAGTVGGSGRNDGDINAVAVWPTNEADEYSIDHIAVLINSDGVHGGATGYDDNRGLIVTRGGHSNGSGGDVFFHGRGANGNPIPTPGHIDDAGDGTGQPGTFGGKLIIIVGPTF